MSSAIIGYYAYPVGTPAPPRALELQFCQHAALLAPKLAVGCRLVRLGSQLRFARLEAA